MILIGLECGDLIRYIRIFIISVVEMTGGSELIDRVRELITDY